MRRIGLFVLAAVIMFAACKKETRYTIVVKSNNAEYGMVSGGGEYAKGEKVSITATANEGYLFIKWDDEQTNNPRQIVVSKDASYTAIFGKKGTIGSDDLEDFVNIKTDGRYTFMTTATNTEGGEEVEISKDY